MERVWWESDLYMVRANTNITAQQQELLPVKKKEKNPFLPPLQ